MQQRCAIHTREKFFPDRIITQLQRVAHPGLLHKVWGASDLSPQEVTSRRLIIGWGVVVAIAAAFETMGQVVFHATNPLGWLAVMAILSVIGVFGIVVTWRASARPEHAQPQDQAA